MSNPWGYIPPIQTLAQLHVRCTAGENGCILYRKTQHRYGIIVTIHGRDTVSRSAWRLSRGPIPEGMEVCHSCDVPRCCNPDHLFLGTHADNMQDKVAKGRHRGPTRLLSSSQVLQMHAMRLAGQKIQPIADKFGVSYVTAQQVLSGTSYYPEFEAFCASLQNPHPTQPLLTR